MATDNLIASLPELMVYRELIRRNLFPDLDFYFQSPLFGGRVRGGYVIDFMFGPTYPGLAINVQGTYYHYEQGSGRLAQDELLRAQMAGMGITLIFIDEDDIMDNVRYYVGEALQYRDHSRLG